MREAGYGVKAATVTPEGKDDVGSPNRILREEVDGKVIIRTGRRIPGVTPIAGVHHPISVVRMAVEDAYGAKQWREGDRGRARRGRLPHREGHALDVPRGGRVRVPHRPRKMGGKVYGGPKWTVSPVYEGMLKEELDAAAARNPDVTYQPVLIDATYAGLISSPPETPLVIPALNRDGDCLSDLVMPMFGSIAGAESVLLAFDEEFETQVAMAEAPHGTAPALQGKDVANPMAMILACGAVLHYAGVRGYPGAERASRAIYESVLEATRRRRAHARPGRPRDHVGLHQRGRRARAHEDRRLVLAGHRVARRRGPGCKFACSPPLPSDARPRFTNTCSPLPRTPGRPRLHGARPSGAPSTWPSPSPRSRAAPPPATSGPAARMRPPRARARTAPSTSPRPIRTARP